MHYITITYRFSSVNNLDDSIIVLVRNASGKSNLTAAAVSASIT